MKQEILSKFLLSQTSLRDTLSFSEFSKLPELNKLVAGSGDSQHKEQVLRVLYQALLDEDFERRNQVQNSIAEFSTGTREKGRKISLSRDIPDPSINAIFTETLIQTLNSKSKQIERQAQESLAEITESTDALLNVTAATKLKRSKGGGFELSEDTVRVTGAAAQEISDLVGELHKSAETK